MQQSDASITTVSAALFLNINSAVKGDDHGAADILSRAKSIGEALDLFGAATETVPTDLEDTTAEWLRAKSSTAWGLFNFVT